MLGMRFCEHLSEFGTSSGEDSKKLIEVVKRYLKSYYIKFMMYQGHHYIYRRDPYSKPTKKSYWCDCDTIENCGHASPDANHIRFGVLQRKAIMDSEIFGMKQITAVSQGSVNYYLANKWRKSLDALARNGSEAETCLAHYNLTLKQFGTEVFFSALFEPPELQFNCEDGKEVIFYVMLKDGYLRLLNGKRELVFVALCGPEGAFS